ncbi:MAG: lipoyl synthase [Candidatus Aminicenantes bacterium]|nr:lipoyl synthase [Candidatus Aminicenantes bacterium]
MTSPKPGWLKVRFPSEETFFSVASLLEGRGLRTVCRSARCPNIGECWTANTATFLILGDVCTRGCAFCAVAKGLPAAVDPGEPARLAEAASSLGLRYVVVTSVARDDLPDGGAGQFAAVIGALRRRIAGVEVEVLIPDFGGDPAALRTVVEAAPDVLAHNLEATASVYSRINRPQDGYGRSLGVLRRAAEAGCLTKSGLMIGLGETEDDILAACADIRETGCRLLTIGQYLQPTRRHVPVSRYYPPEDFARLQRLALEMGFAGVAAGPLVRSSYRARDLAAGSALAPENRPCAS